MNLKNKNMRNLIFNIYLKYLIFNIRLIFINQNFCRMFR